MLKQYEEIKTKFEEGDAIFENASNDVYKAANEIRDRNEKVLDDLANINIIISDIDKQFN